MRKTASKCLNYYDKQPLAALALGFIGLLVCWALLGWLNAFLTQIASINQVVSLMLIGVIGIALTFIPMLIFVSLAAECMWRIFFIYRILNVSGQPIRNGWERFFGNNGSE